MVGRIAPRPVLLIHGRDAQNGQERKYNRVYEAAAGKNTSRWEIPGSGHTGGLDARPRGVRTARGGRSSTNRY